MLFRSLVPFPSVRSVCIVRPLPFEFSILTFFSSNTLIVGIKILCLSKLSSLERRKSKLVSTDPSVLISKGFSVFMKLTNLSDHPLSFSVILLLKSDSFLYIGNPVLPEVFPPFANTA